MKAIIFGANGQDGHYLAEQCRRKNIEAISVSRSGDHLRCDVSDRERVEQLITTNKPAYIFHLAARSTTRHDALFENHATIATGTLNILESVKDHSPSTRVFITGSGLQFRNTGNPISERDAFEASSAYSVARIHSAYAARYYRSLGLKTYVGYLFHHESPLRKSSHVCQMIAQSVKRISEGSTEVIEIGDITVEKEWTFAGDVARGIFALIEQDAVHEAAIGSGRAYSIEHWLEQCFQIIGRDWRNHVRLRGGFTPEYKRLVSDPSTMNALGWFPEIDLPKLADMMISARTQDSS
ncbi:MAG: GDP-mannose 4,6-dehydratase [Nitrospirota bacterium]